MAVYCIYYGHLSFLFFNKVSGEGKGAYVIVCVEGVFTLLRYESGYLILVSVNLTIFVH